jgi:hypothetical protein
MCLHYSGRFNTNTRLCLSMSDFHPETWVPAWSVASILNGVLSFMLESTPTVGSVEASDAERRRLAHASHAFNRKTPIFCELFPQVCVRAKPTAVIIGACQVFTAMPPSLRPACSPCMPSKVNVCMPKRMCLFLQLVVSEESDSPAAEMPSDPAARQAATPVQPDGRDGAGMPYAFLAAALAIAIAVGFFLKEP